jgi:hypothetical protein
MKKMKTMQEVDNLSQLLQCLWCKMLETRESSVSISSITLLSMQRPAGQKRQFYGYLPIGHPYCRHGKRNTLETAWSNAHDLGKILYHITKVDH